MPAVSVIVPAHNPDPLRFDRTLRGLCEQTLPASKFEVLVVDNASTRFPEASAFAASAPGNLRVIAEPKLGLTFARRRGLAESKGDVIVLVDDDNVLAADYLERVVAIFTRRPQLGAAGGKSLPLFERAPDGWAKEFLPLLALRDLGPAEIIAAPPTPDAAGRIEYPSCAPIGAGLALRRDPAIAWAAQAVANPLPDRSGAALTSGGDNDLVFTVLAHGWHVGYFPELSLTHLIPATRLEPAYLGRLNRGIQQSWMQVLTKHHANPWPPIAGWSVPWRKLKAWFTYRAWSSPAARIRWLGACGHFEGRRR